MSVPKTSVSDPMALFRTHRAAVSGLCVYDPALTGTLNVAATAAGILGCVVASPTLAQTLTAAPYGIPIVLDLRNRAFADNRAAYAWAKTEFWSRNLDPGERKDCGHVIRFGYGQTAIYGIDILGRSPGTRDASGMRFPIGR